MKGRREGCVDEKLEEWIVIIIMLMVKFEYNICCFFYMW